MKNLFKKVWITVKNEIKPAKFFDYELMENRKVKCDKCFLHATQIFYEGDYPEPAKLKGRCIWHEIIK